MKLEIAIEVLKTHNKWRRCQDDSVEQCSAKDVGIAIDRVINHYESTTKLKAKSKEQAKDDYVCSISTGVLTKEDIIEQILNAFDAGVEFAEKRNR